jgi:hypothetical protein
VTSHALVDCQNIYKTTLGMTLMAFSFILRKN